MTQTMQKPVDIIEEGKVEDSKRKFMVPYRPHERIWNFEYDDLAKKPKHVLRANAKPTDCYIDGRIEKLFEVINKMSVQIKLFNAERWNKLCSHTLQIFKDHE